MEKNMGFGDREIGVQILTKTLLCDLGQVTSLFWGSVSYFMKCGQ